MIVNDYPTIHLLLRGDSGFATPDLYKQCEENGTNYVIRLKENKILREKASFLADALTSRTQNNKVDYAVVYGEFMYKAGPWPYERRVVCKIEKPENQMVLHVCLYCHKHGFLTGISHQILLQKRFDGKLHQRKQIWF